MPKAATVDAYLAALPADRREALAKVRAVIRENLPEGYEEGIQYGIIGYYVPFRIHPAGYHANPKEPVPFAHLASQKSHMALYLGCVYGDDELRRWFEDEYRKSGKKLDMGKSCVRFKKLDDLPLDLVGRAVARVPVAAYLARVAALLPASREAAKGAKRAAKRTKVAAKPAAKKPKVAAKAKVAAKKPKVAPKPKVTAKRAGKR